MRPRWDVCIAGGGPAGLAAAIALQVRGLHVILADGLRPPIDKACGEGLMPDSVAAMQRLGVNLPAGCARPFTGIRFAEDGEHVDGDFSRAHGLGVRRTVLHQELVTRAEKCGVTLRWGAPVSRCSQGGISAGGEEIRADWIVGADGAQSRVRHWAGLAGSTQYRRRFAYRRHYRIAPWSSRMEVHWSDAGQAYVTPLGPSEICVAVISRNPQLRLEAVLETFPELRTKIACAAPVGAERGAVTSMHALRRVCRGNVALVGDASGSVDAITGEGLGLSFRQAMVLADAIVAGDLRVYQREHRRLARRPRLMARSLLLLERQTWLRRRVLRALADGNLFRRLLRIHTGEAPGRDLVTIGALLGLRLLES